MTYEHKKTQLLDPSRSCVNGGNDGTRTRDLRRDKPDIVTVKTMTYELLGGVWG
jgi:hypothetical protein